MFGRGSVWAFLGLLGLREIVLLALVVLALYGRSGLRDTRHARFLRPWRSVRRPPPSSTPGRVPGVSKPGDRAFWVLAITAATAVAAWIVTRMMIVGGPGPSR